jgi:hypothetical protein
MTLTTLTQKPELNLTYLPKMAEGYLCLEGA